jgi:hypothetical protein
MGDEQQPGPASFTPRIGVVTPRLPEVPEQTVGVSMRPTESLRPRIGVVTPLSPTRVEAPLLSGRELKTMAMQGGFAVDDATGNEMIKALEGIIDSLNSRWQALQKIGDTPQLSATATAQWVSGHMQNTATDGQGLLTQLQQAKNEFPTYVEAIKLAKRNYQEQDEHVRQTISEVKPLS